MQEVASLNFLDFGFNEEAYIDISVDRDLIAVFFSLRRHGDIELMLHVISRTVSPHYSVNNF